MKKFVDHEIFYLLSELSEEIHNSLLEHIILGRLGEADEIASVVNFLASDKAGYITGQTISVNGGMYMG